MMKYSFVVPIYNDGKLAENFCREFDIVFRKYLSSTSIESEVEVIFVNDGSRNTSILDLRKVCEQFPFAKLINLSRNFGQHIAVCCGYQHASGEYVGTINVDMEDPPDQIPLVLEKVITKEFDVVFGLRENRQSSWHVRLTSYLFNQTLNKLTGNDVPLNTATLRVMNRKFTDAFNSLTEKNRFIPGLESWLGFNRGYVKIRLQGRKEGKSSYNFRRRWAMAFNAIISFSDIPLKAAVYAGFFVSFIGVLLGVVLVITKLTSVNFQPGYTSTVSLIVFFNGVQMVVIGLASLYIGRILQEVQNRPLYLITEKVKL